MKIGDKVYVQGYVDEIRKDTIIIRNKGGYFGTVPSEVIIGEVPEREKGKWLYKSELGWGETWLCSECGEKTTSTIMGKPRYNWCPMCGADMRGET